MKIRQRSRLALTGALLMALAAGPVAAVAASEPDPAAAAAELQQMSEALINPSEDLVAARAQLTALSQEATQAASAYATAESKRVTALATEVTARAAAAAATSLANEARGKLGDYAATAYISGGTSATAAAALASGTPGEMVARQNTLSAVADTSTDLVRVLRDAEAAAAAARLKAERAAQDAVTAAAAAQTASQTAIASAAQAQTLLTALVAQELEAQEQVLAEAALRAQVAAYAVGAGSSVVDAHGDPLAFQAFGNGKIPRELLSQVGETGHYLWPPAARALEVLMADAEAAGVHIGITDSYRTYESQVDVANRKGLYSQGGLAAAPGSSDHGWGTAVDLALDAKALAWIRTYGAVHGFVEDVPRESWHWHFLPTS